MFIIFIFFLSIRCTHSNSFSECQTHHLLNQVPSNPGALPLPFFFLPSSHFLLFSMYQDKSKASHWNPLLLLYWWNPKIPQFGPRTLHNLVFAYFCSLRVQQFSFTVQTNQTVDTMLLYTRQSLHSIFFDMPFSGKLHGGPWLHLIHFQLTHSQWYSASYTGMNL